MAVKLYREYRLKFYLNARHFIVIGGQKGEVHPHTWELALTIRIGRGSFTPFNRFERCINAYLAPYQNQILNQCKPFDTILPTLENIADYFSQEFLELIAEVGGNLTCVEVSETPTRGYILDMEHTHESHSKAMEEKMLLDMIDTVLDDLL